MVMGVIPSLKKATFCGTVEHSPYRSARSNNSKSMHKRAESSNVARFEDVRSLSYSMLPSVNRERVNSLIHENEQLKKKLNEQLSPS